MVDIDKEIEKLLEKLVKEGNDLIDLASHSDSSLDAVQVSKVSAWVSRCCHIIEQITDRDNPYVLQLSSILAQEGDKFYHLHSNNYIHLAAVHGIIAGIYEEYKQGLLVKLKGLLRAEIFGDFLEMADYLLKDGYKDAAAVITGGVLEDSLRKLANANSISILKSNGKQKTIDPLNQDLYSNGVYGKLINKQITTWADVRNNAAHGLYDKYDEDDVRHMIEFVQKFCSNFLT